MFEETHCKVVERRRVGGGDIDNSCVEEAVDKSKDVANILELSEDILRERHEEAKIVWDNPRRR